ncbi:MAG TPA: hypothetical protein VES88_07230 [Gemmatimonadaceae bacterium]|nr:hypothetical protein [Gemmatimonadaceae bacterium]
MDDNSHMPHDGGLPVPEDDDSPAFQEFLRSELPASLSTPRANADEIWKSIRGRQSRTNRRTQLQILAIAAVLAVVAAGSLVLRRQANDASSVTTTNEARPERGHTVSPPRPPDAAFSRLSAAHFKAVKNFLAPRINSPTLSASDEAEAVVLLTQTRVLIDSPASATPESLRLLSSVESLLADVAFASASSENAVREQFWQREVRDQLDAALARWRVTTVL